MGGRRPGPTTCNPFTLFTPPRTPGPLGVNDAAAPGTITCRADTPGILGASDGVPFDPNRLSDLSKLDFVLGHTETASHLVESVGLSDLHAKDQGGLWDQQNVWSVGGAIVFRVPALIEDLDGSGRAYHPPTDASWNGYGPYSGLAKDSLANAVGNPGVSVYAHTKDESKWALTAGCQLFRDLQRARSLEPVAVAANLPGAGKAATDAKDALDKIFKTYGVTKLADLETKSLSAVCVLYVDGRPKENSRADWNHVVSWVGVQTDKAGKPLVRKSGPNAGFYLPGITPGWGDAEKHPWVVLNAPEDEFGVNLTNSAVVIKNGETPTIAFGMVGDKGPKGHLGEVSRKMLDDLGFSRAAPAGDYIVVLFPKDISTADMAKEKALTAIQSDAKAAFEAWTWEGRSGMDLIKELFPTADTYHRAQKDYENAKRYWNAYFDQTISNLLRLKF